MSEMGDSDRPEEASPEEASTDAGAESASETGGGSAEQPAAEPGESDPAEAGSGEFSDVRGEQPSDSATSTDAETEAPGEREPGEGEPGEGEPGEGEPGEGEPGESTMDLADGDGDPKEAEEAKSQWQQNLERGHQFNVENRPRYPYNEIQLESGRRVDSYVPGEEIVERKHSQLADIEPDTAKSYIDSLNTKYAPLQKIADTPKNRELKISGTLLEGESVLEIPSQDKPIPNEILDYARLRGVVIRDTSRRVYS